MPKKIFPSKFFLYFLILSLIPLKLLARAGGGGDYGGGSSSSHSGGGDGGGDFVFFIFQLIFHLIPFPFNFLVIGLIIFLFFYFAKNAKTNIQQKTIFNNLRPIPLGSDVALPYGDKEDLKSKIQQAFLEIQKAWQSQNLSSVRKYISDGVYQRFNIQFILMQILEQKNTIFNTHIHQITLVNTREENDYIVVDAAIRATIKDDYSSLKYPKFNQGGSDTFVEYWSFIRKKKVKESKGLYSSNSCPQCGNELPNDAGEIAQCKSCKVLVNSGDYDWVLSEITQALDYQLDGFKKLEKQTNKILEKYKNDVSFSIQRLEDKASNAFLQILTAKTKHKPELARRFVSDVYFEKLKSESNNNEKIFVRLYLNSVDLVNSYTQDGKDWLIFNIKYTQQQGLLQGQGELLDQAPQSYNKVMILTRASNAQEPKGQLYAHFCPNCAAPLTDTLDIRCPYCSALLNSPEYEWIVDNLYSDQEYLKMKDQLSGELVTAIMPEDSQKRYQLRDYVFNNILIIFGADGQFKDQEMIFLRKLIQNLKYNETKISEWIELAKQKKLSMIWPYSLEDKNKVYTLMEKAALADGSLTGEEKILLDEARKRLA